MKHMVLATAAAILAAAQSAAAADSVMCSLTKRENPDMKTLLSVSASLSNAENIYGFGFSNKRAHDSSSRKLNMAVSNGLQNGFSALVNSFALTVNGIEANKLQVKEGSFRKLSGKNGAEGFVFSLNFDGVPVDVRFAMRPGSPILFGDVSVSQGKQLLTPITNVVVKITAIPSFLDCGSGRPTRFSKYARQVQTDKRLIALPPNKTEKMLPDDRFFILQDGEYDGSAKDKGNGPSAVWAMDSEVPGRIVLNDSWTTHVEFKPDLSRPFRFAMLEFKSRRVSNGEMLSLVRKLR